ncbi:hypothetical protein OSB04_014824, partial [Centaurea solstitialis]
MEIVTAIVTPVVESLMVPIKKHIGYLVSCTKYVRDMGTKMHLLKAKRLGVENQLNWNKSNNLEVPPEVNGWLEEVVKIDAQVESIPTDVGSCFNLKCRHKLGRKAFKIIEKINRVIDENSIINWTNHPIPLGKVDSMKPSTSTPSSHRNDFKSRERTFTEALKALEPDHKSHMIALCGMGGVGKTTMMEKLKKVVIEKKMFDLIVEATVGEKTDPISIQQSVADFLSVDLTEKTKAARASKLQKNFEAHFGGGKKILIILDDIWQVVDLHDIGLSHLPNQGVHFKVLMTSRNRRVCTMMGVEVDSILNVDVLKAPEAQSFFRQFVKFSDDVDLDLRSIGDDIASRCHGLPIAIKTIAYALKDKSNKHVWEDTLSRLKNHDIDEVLHQIFEMSYNNLHNEETKSTLLLCGLFPEDFDTPKEDVMRYGWGLKLFHKVYTIREARDRLNTCIDRLVDANLLIQSEDFGCFKMHDLVRAFILDKCSKGENSFIVGNMSKWPTKDMSESCKRISLECTDMLEFTRGCKYPNLLLLKLMHGKKSLTFPEDFYEEMRELQVIAYDKLEYPLLSGSLQCSTNLRTLCLHRCLLMFDCSPIGNLLNLEVLSFAHCSIQKLPSTIGNLKELKLLDLTGCTDLIIDDGVFTNLIKLEEIYMKVSVRKMGFVIKAIRFTDSICNELVEISKNLFALEVEFFDTHALPKNMCFRKLERFKISLGCSLSDIDGQNRHHSYENTLILVTNKCELLNSRMNELFEKTKLLHFQVNDINDLGDVLVESLHHQRSSFYNLRVLEICECENLRYLFTVWVANGLTKLERLKVSSCKVLETLVDGDNYGVGMVKFQALKFLYLCDLPKLISLSNAVNVIELPQLEELKLDTLPNFTSVYPENYQSTTSSLSNDISTMQPFLNEKVVIPPLKKLQIIRMERLKDIWSSNPIPLLQHLEELVVGHCGSIEVLFNIDLRCDGNMEEVGSCLRSIRVWNVENLREIWRINGANDGVLAFSGFQAIETLWIERCKRFRHLFTPTTTSFDLRALTEVFMRGCGEIERNNELPKSSQKKEINVTSNEEISEVGDAISNVVLSSNLIHTFHHVRTLHIENHEKAEVVFEIESPCSRDLVTTHQNTQQWPILPYLKDLRLKDMECLHHVWKCNWSKFLIYQKQHESSSSFHNLTTISIEKCKNIKYLFSPLMAKLLSNLKTVTLHDCDVIEEVVSNRDDEDEGFIASINTSPGLFPHLDYFSLTALPNLKRIGCGGAKGGTNEVFSNTTTSISIHDQFKLPQVNDVAWSLCQYARAVNISNCQELSYVVPFYALGQTQKLENLIIMFCDSLVEVCETQGFNISGYGATNTDGGNGGTIHNTMANPRRKTINVFELSNLKELEIGYCGLMQHVFTFSMLESLMQLKKLGISYCKAVEVIVKEENEAQIKISSKVVVFPRLKSIALCKLPNLTGFFLGKNEFQWPLLEDVSIDCCPQMRVFTYGCSITPKLKYIHTDLGKHSLECGLNFPDMATTLPKISSSSLDTINSYATTSKGTPWSFHNLIEIDVSYKNDAKNIIPSNELLQLQKLEKIRVGHCSLLEEVFEASEGIGSSSELQSVVVKIPKLREVKLEWLWNLKNIWKNNSRMVLEFPNLTKLSINVCNHLEHVFTSSMFGSLLQLQELCISRCVALEVIVKEEEQECDAKLVHEIIRLPHLRSLTLESLRHLKGFCLGKEAFSWPSLDTLKITGCPEISVFTKGDLATPELRVIDTSFGRCELVREEDLNSFINTIQQE